MATKVVFLGIERILYNHTYAVQKKTEELFPDIDLSNRDQVDVAASHLFNKQAVANLESLLDKDVKIVINSGWADDRSIEQLKSIFANHHFSHSILDRTPDQKDPEFSAYDNANKTSCPITYWLQKHPEVTNYVVLHASGKGKSEDKHYVNVNGDDLLTQDDVQKARQILEIKV